jgi:hypothetical protein
MTARDMTAQYEYVSEAEAIAQKRRLERLGQTVFTPYYQPRTLRQNGLSVGGTWNIIIR